MTMVTTISILFFRDEKISFWYCFIYRCVREHLGNKIKFKKSFIIVLIFACFSREIPPPPPLLRAKFAYLLKYPFEGYTRKCENV